MLNDCEKWDIVYEGIIMDQLSTLGIWAGEGPGRMGEVWRARGCEGK